ncbi:fructose-2,6-bisphosphatase TIGAR [Callorhinchus milii]|uniref:Fructose-2,6-bisphosphatase TIGAR n=1 Tax=Callorhinchus milii TaxID=7868 RepID=V9KUF6_CALMI|nr:fructose-2,6-bisphosphatase TIGAR [Callorhinchus milii]|eukprot:gi/632971830/ref/XP_007902363.1/ PREDICTED: fructose-2,6-bisphosphatase TIGAR [Callorhinchus milii]
MRFSLFLVRHGETKYNKAKLLQGQGVDEPLSDTGFKQAEAAGKCLSDAKFTHVFSSDLQRAKQTASTILLKNNHGSDLELILDQRLRERNYGIAEGKPLSDLRAMAKAAGQKCPYFTPPGAETVEEVQARAKEFFNFLCEFVVKTAKKNVVGVDQLSTTASCLGDSQSDHVSDSIGCSTNLDCSNPPDCLEANILIVSHGGYMMQWVRYFLEDLKCSLLQPSDPIKALSVSPNTGISNFIISLNLLDKPQVECLYLNKSSHLVDISTSQEVLVV